ncbi:MAG: LDL receptor domain-containing protein [Polyangiaceae bacterium]|nr:LDL receptor domain-containing protein [Polyangiaceae bacterium]
MPSQRRQAASRHHVERWAVGVGSLAVLGGCTLPSYETNPEVDRYYLGPSGCGDGFTCSEGSCVDAQAKCDGDEDCTDGSDESDCSTWSVDLVNADGWVGGAPELVGDNPVGFQGAWYTYGDNITCSVTEGNPCTADGCCLDWVTTVDPDYDSWGCGVGLELNSTDSEASTKLAYSGAARGFSITITGTSGQSGIRIAFTQALATENMVSPFLEVDGVGTYSFLFTDAVCPDWGDEFGCTAPATPSTSYDLQVQIPGGDEEGSGTICVTSLVPQG